MNQELNIVDIISKLNEAVDLLKKKNISTIEKDLILEKIRNMYETVLLNNTDKIIEKQITPEIIKDIQPEIKNIPEIIETKREEPIIEEIKIPEEEFIAEEKVEEIPSIIADDRDENVPSINMEKTHSKNDIKKSSKTLADQYRDNSSKTLSDVMFKSQPENDLSSKIQLKPIKNIKTAISINDRIMFTKELFNNNPDLYNEIVDKVNSMSNITDALDYFSGKVNIHMENEPVKKFLEIVHRRFAQS